MKNLKLFFALSILSQTTNTHAQAVKVWSKLVGGNATELAYAATNINDSLFAFVGNSNSTDIGNKGLTDMIICVMNKNGEKKYLKTFGSPTPDQLNAVDILPNGNLITAGQVNGAGGDVATNYGLIDGYIMSYNPITNTRVWGKNFGGTNNDQISDLVYLEPGKIIFCGSSKSLDKDLPPNMGLYDAFVGTIDESGNIVRVKTFAGSKDDYAKKIAKINAGAFYVAGETLSNNEGAFLGLVNKGKKDAFVLKLNRNTNQLSAFMVGGPGDDLVSDILATSDGGCMLVLNVNTAGGDIDSLHGGKDIAVMRFNDVGKLIWKRNIGGSKDDEAVSSKLNSAEELVIVATSNSVDKDIKGNYGDKDIMLFKLNANGELISSTNYGGSRGEAAGSMLIDGPNTYLTSSSYSTNDDLPSSNPGAKFWALKLFECSTSGVKYSPSICIGDTLNLHGKKFYAGNSTGQIILPKAGLYGCDSIIDVDLVLNSATFETLRDTFCNDGSTTINGILFNKNNSKHTFPLKNTLGCDSTLTVDLLFNDPIAIIDSTLHSDNGTNSGFVHIAVVGGKSPYKFEWSNGNRSIDVDNLRFGTYTVVITDDMGCVRSFSFIVRNTVSTNSTKEDALKLYSISNKIVIESDQVIESLNIYNVDGQQIYHSRPMSEKVQVDRMNAEHAIYYLEIQLSDGTRLHRKLFK